MSNETRLHGEVRVIPPLCVAVVQVKAERLRFALCTTRHEVGSERADWLG